MQQRNIDYLTNNFFPLALIMIGLAGMIGAFGADLLGLGGSLGIGPKQISLAVSGASFLAAGVVWGGAGRRRSLGEWLLVGLALFAVAFASDLLIIGGLPELGPKALLISSVVVSLLAANSYSGETRIFHRFIELRDLISRERENILKFVFIAAQLGVLVLLIRQFELENQALYNNIALLTFFGFIIHAILPRQYRLSFFLFLSLSGVFGILGLQNGLWLVGVGLALIGISHLPLSFLQRTALLLLAGSGLAVLRTGLLASPIPNAIWPILGSMFMFRLIVYMYDLKYKPKSEPLATRLSYFFLLPNIVFPLFPIVDYSTYRDKYYSSDPFVTYQNGVRWIFWGTIHLIVYRFVNYYVVLAPEAVFNFGDLVQYIASNIMALTRVSGQFHLAIGILHLFGFNLPRTMREFFLATSFTDFWRRANIYWKDFMLKIFYYPAYMSLKRFGMLTRLVLATVFVFVVTWFLHAYQWFWLRGTFLISAPDITFWTFFGLLVLANSVYETKYSSQKRLKQGTALSLRDLAVQTLKVLGVFSVVSVLYSLWTSPSIGEWLSLWNAVGGPLESVGDLAPVFIVIGLIVVGLLSNQLFESEERGLGAKKAAKLTMRSLAVYTALIGGAYVLSHPVVTRAIGGRPQALIEDLRSARLSDRDAALLLRGYYEDLIGINQFNSELWEVYTKRPADWPLIQETAAARLTDDFLSIELVPNQSIIFHGQKLTINRWGMRDRDYPLEKSPGTYRVALIGPSFVMGSGVADGEVFDWILEDRLNQEQANATYHTFEILNFGVPGYSALQELLVLEQRAMQFDPDAIFFVGHQHEEEIAIRNLAGRVLAGSELPYDYLETLLAEAGVHREMSQVEIERALKPYGKELLAWTYGQIVALSRERGVLPVWIFIPTLEVPLSVDIMNELKGLAVDAGFVVISIETVFADQDQETVIVAEWDKHPNAKGHRLIAEFLYDALSKNEAFLTDLSGK